MESSFPDRRLDAIATTLSEIRDCWMQISMLLKDHVADTPSLERDEVLVQVERYLARLKEVERRGLE
jgi:hypothetical protein